MKFDFTTRGFDEAYKFLRDTGNLGLIDNELSTDGYTVVYLANRIKEQMEMEIKVHDDKDSY